MAISIYWQLSEKILRIISNFLVGIYAANLFGAADYGIIMQAVSISILIMEISSAGLNSILVKEFIKNKNEAFQTVSTTIIIRLFFSVICVVFLFIFRDSLDSNVWFFSIIISSFMVCKSFDVIDYYFQSQEKFSLVSKVRLVGVCIVSVLKLIVLYCNFPEIYFVISYGLEFSIVLILFIYTYVNQNNCFGPFRLTIAIKLLKNSYILIFSSLAMIIYSKIDLIMVGKLLGNSDAGVYSVAVQFSELAWFFALTFSNVVFPKIISTKGFEKEKLYISSFSFLFISAFIIIIAVMTLVPFVIKWFYNKQFYPAIDVINVYVMSTIFVYWRALVSKWIIDQGLYKYSLYSHLVGAVVNVVLNYFFISKFGLLGAAYSTFVSYFFSTLLIFTVSKESRQVVVYMIKSMNIKNVLNLKRYIL